MILSVVSEATLAAIYKKKPTGKEATQWLVGGAVSGATRGYLHFKLAPVKKATKTAIKKTATNMQNSVKKSLVGSRNRATAV